MKGLIDQGVICSNQGSRVTGSDQFVHETNFRYQVPGSLAGELISILLYCENEEEEIKTEVAERTASWKVKVSHTSDKLDGYDVEWY